MILGRARQVTDTKNKRNLPLAVSAVLGLPAILFLLYWVALHPHSRAFSLSHEPVLSDDSSNRLLGFTDADAALSSSSDSGRPVYPYSVIPGGAENAKELQEAVYRDPLITEHYAGFRTRSARPIRLTVARQGYVSYRLGNHIYWTQKKVTLHAGEMLLTDGEHLARARCGNRISDVPAQPVSPSEPPHEVLNQPVGPHKPELSPDPFPIAPIWEENPSPILLALNSPPPPAPPGGGFPFFPPIPIFPCCGGPAPSPKPSPSPLPQPGPLPSPLPNPFPQPFPPPPPVSTPEPPSLVFLVVGLTGLLFLWKIRRS